MKVEINQTTTAQDRDRGVAEARKAELPRSQRSKRRHSLLGELRGHKQGKHQVQPPGTQLDGPGAGGAAVCTTEAGQVAGEGTPG